MKKILKGTVVLLITVVMVFSTVAIADTQIKQNQINLVSDNETSGEGIGARGGIVWDNGMNYESLLAAQEPVNPGHIDAYPADDFHFDQDTEVCDVHWIGGYWGGDPEPWNWCIMFWYDRGDGEAPGGMYAGSFCYDWDDIEKEELEPSIWEMSVDLPDNIFFPACYKWWITIWAVGDHFPRSGWGIHSDMYILHEAVFWSEWFGYPFWIDTSEVVGYPVDMCFQLTTEGEPSIDVEKYVYNTINGQWVDADTKDEALDVSICDEISYKIVIHNNGDAPLFDIIVKDKLHKSLKYLSSDPLGQVYFEDPYWYIEWNFPGPLNPCETVEIYITAHVEGPEKSYDENYVLVEAYGWEQAVRDDDYAWIHIRSSSIQQFKPFLQFLERHPNMFPLLQKLIQQFGFGL